MEFIRESELEFPEFDAVIFKDPDSKTDIPYFKEIFKCYLGYRQCYSTDLETDSVIHTLWDRTEYEKYVYLYASYLQWLDARSTKAFNRDDEEEVDKDAVAQKYVDLAQEKFIQQKDMYPYVKMCWFIYNHINHQSPLEHCIFQFQFKNMSRACQQQLTRHRIGNSFSIQSQRYVKFFKEGEEASPNFYLPPSIARHEDAKQIYTEYLEQLEGIAHKLRALGHTDIKEEDIRYLYPNAMVGDGIWTVNLRSLINFLHERCCSHAQYEIRQFARGIRNYLCKELPFIGAELGPKCYYLNRCPETKSCGTLITRTKYIPYIIPKK